MEHSFQELYSVDTPAIVSGFVFSYLHVFIIYYLKCTI